MKKQTYNVDFRTDAGFASRQFKARSSQDALKKALIFYDLHPEDLMVESYDGCQPVNEIAVEDEQGNEVAVWHDDDMRLRLAARDLLTALQAQTEAAKAVIANWEGGDLAGAVRALDGSIGEAEEAIARAAPVQPEHGP